MKKLSGKLGKAFERECKYLEYYDKHRSFLVSKKETKKKGRRKKK